LNGKPTSRAAFSTEKFACSDARTMPPGRSSLAAASAAIVEIDAVSSSWPCRPSGRPSSWRSQSTARSSTSVAAGEVLQSIPFTFIVAASSSARIPGSEPVFAK
jgi:hypothetical protein